MAGLVGAHGRVVAYEPSSQHAAWLRENIGLNRLRNVAVHQAALTAEPGSVQFSEGFDVSNATVPDGYAGKSVKVVAETLDQELELQRYALAKLDLEGGEHAALLGAGAALNEGNPAVLLVELMEWQLGKHGSSVEKVRDLLDDCGYDIGVYRADVNAWKRLGHLPSRSEPNVVAIHRSAKESVAARIGGLAS
jgi:FkbM family methyltransferase